MCTSLTNSYSHRVYYSVIFILYKCKFFLTSSDARRSMWYMTILLHWGIHFLYKSKSFQSRVTPLWENIPIDQCITLTLCINSARVVLLLLQVYAILSLLLCKSGKLHFLRLLCNIQDSNTKSERPSRPMLPWACLSGGGMEVVWEGLRWHFKLVDSLKHL